MTTPFPGKGGTPVRPKPNGSSVFVVLAEAKIITRAVPPETSARRRDEQPRTSSRTRVTNDLRRQVITRYQSGSCSAQACADEFAIAKATVLRILKQAGVSVRPQGQRIT